MRTREYLNTAPLPHQRYHAVAITGLRYTFTLLPFVTVPSFHESVDFNAIVVKAVFKFEDGLFYRILSLVVQYGIGWTMHSTNRIVPLTCSCQIDPPKKDNKHRLRNENCWSAARAMCFS